MKKTIEVVAAIIKKNNKYFCAQRKDSGELAKKWEFPGGKIEHNETHEEALTREIHEELNTKIKVKKYIATVNYEYNSFILIMHCYLCDIIEGELELSEHLDSKWASKNEMLNMDFAAADIPVIKYLKD